LRGLSTRGKCPECGELIEISEARAAAAAVPRRPPAKLALGLGIGSCLTLPLVFIIANIAFQFGLLLLLAVSALGAAVVSLKRWGGTKSERAMAWVGALLALLALCLECAFFYWMAVFDMYCIAFPISLAAPKI